MRRRSEQVFDAGLTIFDVQQRLGHHSPTLTAEVYTHADARWGWKR